MAPLKFADSHNMVAFLTKYAESEGFKQIVDFLNANGIINYALTINPTIYTSCVEQFWATVKVKTVNEEVQLQALVDRKKVIITEASIRRDLQLEDAKGIECLPNATIFKELTRIGYEKLLQKLTFYKAFFSLQWKFLIHTILQCLSAKTTAWNEFSSTMASTIICLATNQKFNFLKYIFESMVKNLNNENKFLMYPRFMQVFLNKQVGDMSTHDEIYVTPSHTKKVFANMKRQGKDFSGRVTPLFLTMMVQAHKEIEPIVDEADNEEMYLHIPMIHCSVALEIESLKRRIKKLEKKQRSRPHKLKRLYKVGLSAKVISSDDASLVEEDASKQERINAIDAVKDIYLVNVPRDEDMFGVNDLEGDEVVVESDVAAKKKDDEVNVVEEVVSIAGDAALVSAATITTVELTLAQTLVELKSVRPKVKGLVIPEQEPSESITTTTTKTTAGILLQEPSETRTTTTPAIPSKDKGKGIMEEDPLKIKKKDQVLFDKQEAIRLQAEFDEEERIAREKEEANAALIAQWNDIQDKVETNYEWLKGCNKRNKKS
ncbi:hypothetical protein Tco_1114619 [Tanacetum coccineum]|uniref:Synaptobrevin, longin-like domain protein n=1 Tax=Tanacetum coccineum TaxID=301880 RepID=A0ABQ5IWQ2_9ASTR